MNEIKYLMKQNYSIFKNIIKIGLVKYTLQTFVGIIFGVVFLFLINNYINSACAGFQLTNNLDYFIILKQSYMFSDFLVALITCCIMFCAYKSSESTWNKLKLYNISSDNIFIGYILFYMSIVSIILSFFIISTILALKGGLLLSLIFILFLIVVLMGNVMLGMYIYKLINIKMKTKFSFIVAIIITACTLYLYNTVFWESNLFKSIELELGIFALIPFFIAVIIKYCTQKYTIMFFYNNEKMINNDRNIKIYTKIKNPYVFLLIIEFCREWRHYLEVFIIPYVFIVLFKILNIDISFNDYIWLPATIAAVPIGIYYSYNEVHKIHTSNYKFDIMARILFAIILVSLSCLLYKCIDCDFNLVEKYFESLSFAIIIICILIVLKLPMIIYGKDSMLFYILIYIIPTVCQFILIILNDIIKSYTSIESNLTINYMTLFIIIYIIILKGIERNKLL